MRRFRWILLCSIGLGGCRIEPTPERFIDQQARAEDGISATEAEIRARIASLPDALQEGRTSDLLDALDPHPDGIILGPGTVSPLPAERLTALLEGAAAGERLILQDLVIQVDSANNAAFFISRFVPPEAELSADTVAPGFDFSGVFTREAGDWRLVQGHLSRPIISPPTLPPVSRP